MKRKIVIIPIAILALLGIGATALYEHYIGFSRAPLEKRFPADTYAYFSVSHMRKAALSAAFDDQLKAVGNIIRAVAKTLSDSVTDETEATSFGQVDPALIEDLSNHFKTQISLAAIPAESNSGYWPGLVLATPFFGSEDSLKQTLVLIAAQSSSPSATYQWTSQSFEGFKIETLSVTDHTNAAPSDVMAGFSPSWAIQDGVFFLASTQAALSTILRFNAAPTSQPSLADSAAIQELDDFISGYDYLFHLNVPSIREVAEQLLPAAVAEQNRMLASFSVSKFFQESGLSSVGSITLANQLTGERVSYLGTRYKEKIGVWNALKPYGEALLIPDEDLSISLQESLNFDLGQALLSSKNAALKAAPLAGFAYIGLNSQVYSKTELNLDEAIGQAFEPLTFVLQTLDTGTDRNENGQVVERIVFDRAFKFKLRPEQQLTQLLETYFPEILAANPSIAYQEAIPDGQALYLDGHPDDSLTANRFAVCYDSQYLTIGYGTLRSFDILRKREELINATPAKPNTVGKGQLRLQNMPRALNHLATVFYVQNNPGKTSPFEYLAFDWSSLAVLEQDRVAETIDDLHGHLYRLSRQK